MTNFKVGDKVKIIGNSNYSDNKVGDIGVIKSNESVSGCWRVFVKNGTDCSIWTQPSDMELIEAFKVGDKVKIIGNVALSCNKIGDVGIITYNHGDQLAVQVSGGKDFGNWSCNFDLELVTEDVPTGYRGLPKNMNLKTGDVVKGLTNYYTIKNESVGDFKIERCGCAYTLISRANTEDNPWLILTDRDAVCSYTNDIACFNGIDVAYRKKAPVYEVVDLRIYSDDLPMQPATVRTKDGNPDWETLKKS